MNMGIKNLFVKNLVIFIICSIMEPFEQQVFDFLASREKFDKMNLIPHTMFFCEPDLP